MPSVMDLARPRDGQQQQVELLEGVGRRGRKPRASTRLRLAGLAVHPLVVAVADKRADRDVEFGQGERRLRRAIPDPARGVAGQIGEAHLVDRVEQPLDLAAPARLSGQRESPGALQIAATCSMWRDVKSEP